MHVTLCSVKEKSNIGRAVQLDWAWINVAYVDRSSEDKLSVILMYKWQER